MTRFIAIVFCFVSLATFSSAQSLTFHDYSAETITGDTISMSQYYGKKLMVVNTASFCGYTPQFEDLQSLYEQYQQYNFEIIGFPSNDFGSQDPGSDSAILDFCTANYGVTFQMMHKVDIISGDTAPVYKWLQREDLNGVQNAHVAWNFNKFLIDEAGHWVEHYTSTTNPLNDAITEWIMSPSVITSATDISSSNVSIETISGLHSKSIDILIQSDKPREITLHLYSIDGRYIKTIFDGTTQHDHIIHTTADLSSGLYLISLESAGIAATSRFTVIR